MALSLGTKLGPHEIVAPLGASGMGEVYRAKDTRQANALTELLILIEAVISFVSLIRRNSASL